MLYHHLRAPSQGTDVEQIVVRWRRPTTEPRELATRLATAFAAVAARHEMLRACCRWEELAEPQFEIAADVAPGVVLVPLEADAERVETWLARDRAEPIDLARAPLFRVALLDRAAAPPVLVWTVHHLLLDGRSFETVLGEVFALLGGRAPAELPPLPVQGFGEHARRVHARARGGEEAFWRGQLQGRRAASRLPLPRPTGTPGAARDHARTSVPIGPTAALRALAQQDGASLNTVVQAAWALLWSRYTGDDDVVFGAVRAGRRGTIDGADGVVGTFINTLPFRARVDESRSLRAWLPELRATQRAIAPHEQTSLADVQRWCGLGAGERLFDSVLVFDHATLDSRMRAHGPLVQDCEFELREQTVFPVALYASAEPELDLQLAWDGSVYDRDSMHALLGHLRQLLLELAARPDAPLRDLQLLTDDERASAGAAATPDAPTAPERIAAQAARTPDAVALRCGDDTLTYRELERQADELAAVLRRRGVGRDALVAVCCSRRPALVVAVLAIWKAGAAYVPLDPGYPAQRLRFQLADANVAGIVGDDDALAALGIAGTDRALGGGGPDGAGPAAWVLRVSPGTGHALDGATATGAGAAAIGAVAAVVSSAPPRGEDAAYVIYTSGSTGRPKGVVVEHRNLASFLAAMDAALPLPDRCRWLAVTSLAFDISVLELIWTLARGAEVVLQPAAGAAGASSAARAARAPSFSLFYFASDQGDAPGAKYELLLAGARFADEQGFEAVWTPERHFHAFGGLYPNPAVTSAALATITSRVQLRGGSVVLPLHDPLRVAEEWALVDNLSNGRTGIAFASGWQSDDFVLQPQNYRDRKDVLERGIDVVRRLWRGDAVERSAPDGRTVSVRTLPRPLQPELPVWITSAGNVETWQLAGRLGANVLTHLLGQSLEELRARVDAYRAARRAAGHAGDGHVTLMLHTFVGTSDEEVYRVVRQPMLDYLRSSLSLARSFVGSFPTFRTRAAGEDAALAADVAALAPAELDALLEHSFHRYHDRSGLFGTVGTCLRMVDRCREVGVDEIACLVDFGVPAAAVVDQFRELAELHRRARAHDVVAAEPAVPAAIVQHGITHLQCTPSMAAMLLQQDGGRDALRSLQCLLVGGEALPPPLARELRSLVPVVHNMYGPTETTIWSSSYAVAGDEDVVPIGTPLANTELLVLDRARRVVPRGVPGELYIGGRGVARGYLGRPELTAARFVDHPFRPAERLYRTGDLARHRRDGAFEFLGRLDTQVKVRGHRVELGEIEASLAGHPAVHECAVVVRPGAGGTEQLVAYLTARPAQAVEPAALRAWLAARLPEYMLPNRWVALPELPRTPNLKIDRNALPAPAEPGAASASAAASAGATAAAAPAAGAGAEPTGELEAAIAAIWCEVLAVRTVGPTQNFFDLGGHSLLAVQLQGRLRRTLGHAVALTDLFRFPTVRALAGHLASDGAAAQASATAAQQQSRVHAEQRVQSLRDLRALRERARGRVSGDRTADA